MNDLERLILKRSRFKKMLLEARQRNMSADVVEALQAELVEIQKEIEAEILLSNEVQ